MAGEVTRAAQDKPFISALPSSSRGRAWKESPSKWHLEVPGWDRSETPAPREFSKVQAPGIPDRQQEIALWLIPGRVVLAGELQTRGCSCISGRAQEGLEHSGPHAVKDSLFPGQSRCPLPQSAGGLKGLTVTPVCISASTHGARCPAVCEARGVQRRTKTRWRGCCVQPTAGKRNPAKNLAADK